MKKAAHFSHCGNYRYFLSRQWDETKPWVMFIGLNPSKADHIKDDPTIRRVVAIGQALGYGGIVMVNCFPFISTDPDEVFPDSMSANDYHIGQWAEVCKDVIFCWGNFKVVKEYGRDKELIARFPNALCLKHNKNGSPFHPLYFKVGGVPVKFKQPSPAITTYSPSQKIENA